MKAFLSIMNALCFLALPGLVAQPPAKVPRAIEVMETEEVQFEESGLALQYPLMNFDDVLDLLDDLENDDVEELDLDIHEIERLTQLVALMACNGVLPGEWEEDEAIHADISSLLFEDDTNTLIKPASYNACEFRFVPAVSIGESGYDVVLCRGWFKRRLRKVGKFIKKHKKAIIIGAAVLATVTVVVGVAAVSASAATAAAGAAGTAVEAGTSSNRRKRGSKTSSSASSPPSKPQNSSATIPEAGESSTKSSQRGLSPSHVNSSNNVSHLRHPHYSTPMGMGAFPNATLFPHHVPIAVSVPSTPRIRSIVNTHISDFKSAVFAEALEHSGYECVTPTFGQKVREIGSRITHSTIELMKECYAIAPRLHEEVKSLGQMLLPQSIHSLEVPDSFRSASARDNYNKPFAGLHEITDRLFSTSQALIYTDEAKAAAPFVTGWLPPPVFGANGVKAGPIPATQASKVKGWKVGQPINNLTKKGKVPTWSTVRRRFWKNEAHQHPERYMPKQLERMKLGNAPQRVSPTTGRLQSMELHHVPPQSTGGLFDLVPLWPEQHAAVDAFRHLGG